ncbi:Initiator Replication protein [Nitrosomonas eutropha]|uniref:Initiator Replication protein n=1 Tax=Nitrosomonas eutropha TaxID=916 RepID=A0A1I7JCZ6_9PROT|nr:replication initiation protein [Nitrosomonas eutropha]SFU83011.1 Initiator Replication protein [Nitrosomonas eutropha]
MQKNVTPSVRKLKNDQLRKHVAAIHTSGDLSLLERKMVNVLLLNAYDDLLSRRTHTLPVDHLRAMLGWEESNNVTLLKKILRTLTSTPIEFNIMEDGKETWRVMTMISFGEIKGSICTYRYDEYLAERFYDPQIYAMINLGVQRRFEGGYALTLYENCLRYKSVGSTGWWELERFKKLIGASASIYDEFKYLKREVITKSIKEINRISDILIEAEYRKIGRKVSFIRFNLTENPQKSLLEPELLDDHASIRESETFKRLREHGIGERLAIAWILQDKEQAQAVVDYVEERDKKKLIKGTTAGYIRKLIEDGADVGKSTYEINKEKTRKESFDKEKCKKVDEKKLELEAEYKRHLVTNRIQNLTMTEIIDLVEHYSIGEGRDKTKSYNPVTGKFKDAIERVSFTGWLRSQFLPEVVMNKNEFVLWLEMKNKKATVAS